MSACPTYEQTPRSDESGLGSGNNGSDESPQDDVFNLADLDEEIQQNGVQKCNSRSVHLSGDSGIAEVNESTEYVSLDHRRRTKSDDSESRSSSLRDDLKIFWINKARRLRKLADKDLRVPSARVRSQSIAEEGEYQCDHQSTKSVGADCREERQRRNSDQCSSSSSKDPDKHPQRRRPAVKQFLENLRFRSRHDTEQSMAYSSGSDVSDETLAEKKIRPRSPVGSIINKFRLMTTNDSASSARRRRHSGAAALPHPNDLPLDHSFCADLSVADLPRIRKLSHPPVTGSVQQRHRDLFEQLTHSPDAEGQCSILSVAAMTETQSRCRRMSGSTVPASSCSRQRAVSSSEVLVTENEKYIIFKSRCPNEKQLDIDELVHECRSTPGAVFNKFMQHHKCYDVMPNSSKLLIFDTMLSVKKAFFALVYNGLRAAPLWDAVQQRFTGMLTISDFIAILHRMHANAMLSVETLESHRIATWRSQLKERQQALRWISPEASLLSAARLLLHARVHRLLVMEPHSGNALFIVTHKRLLTYLHLHQDQLLKPNWLRASVQQLNVGSYEGIVTIHESAPLLLALSLFEQHRVSALPVIDAQYRLVDIYSRFDVINLAATKTYDNLNVSIKEALQYRQGKFEGVSTCFASDSLQKVMDQLVTAQVHRLVVIDNDRRVTGIVSLSDLLQAILINYKELDAAVESDEQ